MRFSARRQSGKARQASLRATAVLGIFAILFQAMLGAWHHHPLPFSSGLAAAVVASAPTNEATPPPAEQNCRICFGLGHHRALPVDFFAAALPDQHPLPPMQAAEVAASGSRYPLFHARAPPSV